MTQHLGDCSNSGCCVVVGVPQNDALSIQQVVFFCPDVSRALGLLADRTGRLRRQTKKRV